ncbi:unknown protein [Microcystis aeruginosa NIES-843]|uniref:Uncharacterized protein n=1 Tax=Microcystis aeruginosa (strain NIES-843 / IAM M-2473) TaxID=449447 RepID=B0JQU5_MICAN|nr:unknown protein [Microcystis aeruginosa NIES-843]
MRVLGFRYLSPRGQPLARCFCSMVPTRKLWVRKSLCSLCLCGSFLRFLVIFTANHPM